MPIFKDMRCLLSLTILTLLICSSCKMTIGEETLKDNKFTITTTITDSTIKEGSTDIYTIKVEADKALEEDILVSIAYSGTFQNTDFQTLPTSLQLLKGEKEKSITIVPLNDNVVEPHKTLIANFSTTSNLQIINPSLSFKHTDDEIFYIYMEAMNTDVVEGGNLEWYIMLLDKFSNPLVLNWDLKLKLNNISNTGTYSLSNFVNDPTEITVPAGNDYYQFSYSTKNNTTIDGVQKTRLSYEVTNGYIGSALENLTEINANIIDDDFPIVSVTSSCSLSEASATACNVQVKRLIATTSPLVVNLTYEGTATYGVDYNSPAATITIPANATSANLSLTVVNDTTVEATETIIVKIGSSANYTIHSERASATVNITDNDNSPESRSIEITATAVASPPSLTLSWPESVNGIDYKVFRKELGAAAWGTAIDVAASAKSYTDTTVESGKVYEYKVTRVSNGQGYIAATVNRPYIHKRGDLLVVVESAVATALSAELQEWYQVLAGDGWDVTPISVGMSDTVVSVKAKIIQKKSELPNLKTVLLFGHVPVPYSGQLAPDGHTDHSGAWPTDGYYADIDGVWTDTSVNTSSANRTANRNIPGDGKFDQTAFPSALELAVGRVDMYAMSTFTESETDLLKRYITKNINYRKNNVTINRRALMDDNFGDMSGEAFAQAPWNWFGSLVGRANVFSLDWFTTLQTNHYMWAYGCGGSGYTNIGGVGTTSDFATKTVNAIFTATFGSYFGDFDAPNSALRAIIANPGPTLTSVWSGRPHWLFHTLSVGEPFATSIPLSQKNHNNTYYTGNVGLGQIHISFMGDPTLRDRMVSPVTNLTTTASSSDVVLNWTASTSSGIDKYFIYGSNDKHKGYEAVGSVSAGTVQYTLSKPLTYKYYQVRAGKLDTSLTGTYYNLSTGSFVDTTGL